MAYGSANTYGRSRPIRDHEARYIVVRYLPDDPPPVKPGE
jgi:hypothetical protein